LREAAFEAAFFDVFLTAVFLAGAFLGAVRVVATLLVLLLPDDGLAAEPLARPVALWLAVLPVAAVLREAFFPGAAFAILRAIVRVGFLAAAFFFAAGVFADLFPGADGFPAVAALPPAVDFRATAFFAAADRDVAGFFFGVGFFFAELDVAFLRAVMFTSHAPGTRERLRPAEELRAGPIDASRIRLVESRRYGSGPDPACWPAATTPVAPAVLPEETRHNSRTRKGLANDRGRGAAA
jgi:hypothetical protein